MESSKKNQDEIVDIVSENVSSKEIEVGGSEGYLNYIWIWNRIVKAYENNAYTVGLRCVGYDGSATEICFSSIPQYSKSSCSGDVGYETNIELMKNTLGTLEATDLSNYKSIYHLAPHLVRTTLGSFEYNTRYIQSDGILASTTLRHIQTLYRCVRIRPIVVLKATLKITERSGTEASLYTLGI